MIATLAPAKLDAPIARELIRAAQGRWAAVPLRERLGVISELRHLLAENGEALGFAAASVRDRPLAEKLVSEVLPLADACRWLERNASRVLSTRRCGSRGRPFWMQGLSFEVQRQPFGAVLVIGPGNYPLFLPAVQSLHSLVAGNAVLLKPAPGTAHVARAFADLAVEAGLDAALLTVLPESVEAAREAIDAGVDKVIFTGSSENGRDVLASLAETNTPAIMELSGRDAVIVLADADLDLVVRALRFGLRLNGGETCIAPRRLLVVETVADDLAARLAGARISGIPLERIRDEAAIPARVNSADFALGASIFSQDAARARGLAARLTTGFVVVNDLIVPTADPRMPFGGVKASGYGSTRGEEGLLEMTFPHVVAERSSGMHPHFDEPADGDAKFFSAYLQAAHGRSAGRLSAIRAFVGALFQQVKSKRTHP